MTTPNTKRTKTSAGAFALAAALLCGFAQDAAAEAAPQVVLADSIVAVVNNDVITRQELLEREQLVERRLRNQGIQLPPQQEFQRHVLERMIVDLAQIQLAKDYGIRVDDATLDRAIARIAEQNKMTLPQFREQLEKEGTPFKRFREEIRDEIVMQRLREREVDNKIQVSKSEVDNYLAAQAGAAQSQH